MKSNFRAFAGKALLPVAFVTICTVLASPAHAQCSAMVPRTAVAWQALPAYAPMFQPAGSTQESAADPPRAADASIVGLWQVNFISGGQIVDQAYEVFHSDGTELMVDTSAPASDNVCVGVYVQTVGLAYKLNHVSWTFDNNGNLNGTATIKLNVKLDSNGNSFAGAFTVDVYTLTGSLIQHLGGSVTAKRVTAD